MKLVLAGLAILAVSASAPAFASQQAQTPAPAQVVQAAPRAPTEQVICEREEDTGSRLTAHKICHTRTEWAQIQREEREDLDHRQTQRAMNGN